MLKVSIAVFDLRPGDVIDYDGRILRCVEAAKGDPDESVSLVTAFEDTTTGEHVPIYSIARWTPTLVSTTRAVAERIAEALDGFAPEVRAEAMRFFCSTCGERGCGQHR